MSYGYKYLLRIFAWMSRELILLLGNPPTTVDGRNHHAFIYPEIWSLRYGEKLLKVSLRIHRIESQLLGFFPGQYIVPEKITSTMLSLLIPQRRLFFRISTNCLDVWTLYQ